MKLTAAEENTELVLVRGPYHAHFHLVIPPQIAGEPLDQTVMQYGPFVMTSRREIVEALQDCESVLFSFLTHVHSRPRADQFGRNGFEKAHTWKSVIGNR